MPDSQGQHKKEDSPEWGKKNEVTARKEYLGYSKILNTIKSKLKSPNRISGDISASVTWQLSLLDYSDNEAML